MIKLLATDPSTGGTIIGLGLSDRNVDLLKAGRPIIVKLQDMDPRMSGEILIFYGQNERLMEQWLSESIGPTTDVHRTADPKTEHL